MRICITLNYVLLHGLKSCKKRNNRETNIIKHHAYIFACVQIEYFSFSQKYRINFATLMPRKQTSSVGVVSRVDVRRTVNKCRQKRATPTAAVIRATGHVRRRKTVAKTSTRACGARLGTLRLHVSDFEQHRKRMIYRSCLFLFFLLSKFLFCKILRNLRRFL